MRSTMPPTSLFLWSSFFSTAIAFKMEVISLGVVYQLVSKTLDDWGGYFLRLSQLGMRCWILSKLRRAIVWKINGHRYPCELWIASTLRPWTRFQYNISCPGTPRVIAWFYHAEDNRAVGRQRHTNVAFLDLGDITPAVSIVGKDYDKAHKTTWNTE